MDVDYRSAKSLSKELGITCSLFETWYRIYKRHGASGLLPKKGKRVFSPSFKLKVLETIQKENLSLTRRPYSGCRILRTLTPR